jgi:hypothetical protein
VQRDWLADQADCLQPFGQPVQANGRAGRVCREQ